MPWFITAITPNKILGKPAITRTFGFYEKFIFAYDAITENRCNMHECLYEYIVLEYIEEGIHPDVIQEYWWHWVEINNRWEDRIGKPFELTGIINWALG